MPTVKATTRVLLLTCCFFVVPALAELNLDIVGEGGAPPDAKPDTGVKVRAGGGQGGTAIHWMAFNGDEAGVRLQIIDGADIDGRLKTGGTPLHLAAYNGHIGVVKLLIGHGARVNARTKAGITPLDWARKNGHQEVAELLVAHGAKASTASRPGPTGPATVTRPGTGGDATGSASAPRRKAPLKYSLYLVPPDSVVVNQSLKAEPPAQKTTRQENPPAQGQRNDQAPAQEKRTAPNGAYRIQLGAFSSEQRARDAWALYRKKYPDLLGSRGLILDRTTIKGKSYHRVQTGPMSRSDAWAICDRLKQAGQACAVMTQRAS